MGQYREITREVTIPAGTKFGPGTARVWDAPTGSPIKNITIAVSTGSIYLDSGAGAAAAAVASLAYEVFYGGHWAGAPFDEDSTHSGGVSQGIASSFPVSTEIAGVVYEDSSTLPTNRVGPNVQRDMKKYGLPIVLELSNINAFAVTLYVTFVSETLATNV